MSEHSEMLDKIALCKYSFIHSFFCFVMHHNRQLLESVGIARWILDVC